MSEAGINYYEHHLGDYLRDTAHLSMIEDCAYRRLLDAYYIREKPLPVDLRECCKVARAASKAERDAVAYVLREFFKPGDDGQHQPRADAEIARFQDKQRKAKASADERWSHTERNANASPNASPNAMRTHTERNANASPNAMRTHSERNADGMHRAPVPSPQSPVPSITPTLTGGPPTDPKPNARPKTTKTPMPPDFAVSDRVRRWAAAKGYTQLDAHLEAFRAKVAANAYRYADWDSAFAEAIREDWAKLRGRTSNGAAPPAENAERSNPQVEQTQAWLAEQRQAAATATPPPASILALRSRKQEVQ